MKDSDVNTRPDAAKPDAAKPDAAKPDAARTGGRAALLPGSHGEETAEEFAAWELIDAEAGRYMPRRIRGSFRGRALG